MAMTLLDAGLPSSRFHIDAFDVSAHALARAERGIYTRNSFRGADLAFRGRHFDQTPDGYRVRDSVRRFVRFRQGNICDPVFLADASRYDVVFCRNLLIYLDEPALERAIGLLERVLAPHGLLCVGASETSQLLSRRFVWTGTPRAFAFRGPAEGPPPVSKTLTVAVPRAARRPSSRVVVPAASKPTAPRHARGDESSATPQPDLGEATRLADVGRFGEAVAICEAHAAQHGPSADAFYLLGLVHEATGRTTEAITCYRKALYLDQEHYEVLRHLALLMEGLDRTKEAQVLRNRERRLHSTGRSAS